MAELFPGHPLKAPSCPGCASRAQAMHCCDDGWAWRCDTCERKWTITVIDEETIVPKAQKSRGRKAETPDVSEETQ
jgi:hypothetical protein